MRPHHFHPTRGFTLIELLVVISIISLLIGILLPALGAARRAALRVKSSNNARSVGQAMIVFGDTNNGYYPGLDTKNNLLPADRIEGSAANGSTPGSRYVLLLTRNHIVGETIISPFEQKTEWRTTGQDIDSTYYSYAMLALDLDGDDERDAAGRVAEWRNTFNTRAVLLADRNTGSDADGSISSVHTETDGGDWRGTVLWGAGHVVFETGHPLTTRCGNGQLIDEDNLFAEDEDADGEDGMDAALVYQDATTLVGQQ